MDLLLKKIEEARNLKPSSAKAYLTNLNKLNEMFDGKFSTTVLNFDKTKQILTTFVSKKTGKVLSQSTIKNFVALLNVVVQVWDKTAKKKNVAFMNQLLESYSKWLNDLKVAYEARIKTGKKTDKEKDLWIDYPELKKEAIEFYEKKVRANKINYKKKQVLTKTERDILKSYLICCLYLLDPKNNPPIRNEYAGMKVITKQQWIDLSNKDRYSNNYLIIFSKNKKEFHFANTKNSQVEHKIVSGPLNRVINLYLKFHDNREYFLYLKNEKKPMDRNSLTKFCMRTFNAATGKKISTSMLRKIVDTYLFKELKQKIKEGEEHAKKSHHSLATKLKVYVKED